LAQKLKAIAPAKQYSLSKKTIALVVEKTSSTYSTKLKNLFKRRKKPLLFLFFSDKISMFRHHISVIKEVRHHG